MCITVSAHKIFVVVSALVFLHISYGGRSRIFVSARVDLDSLGCRRNLALQSPTHHRSRHMGMGSTYAPQRATATADRAHLHKLRVNLFRRDRPHPVLQGVGNQARVGERALWLPSNGDATAVVVNYDCARQRQRRIRFSSAQTHARGW
jgi:hypothetical protein